QAEDGIRGFHVTGVQTCALPIFYRLWGSPVFAVNGISRYRREGAQDHPTARPGLGEHWQERGSCSNAQRGEVGLASPLLPADVRSRRKPVGQQHNTRHEQESDAETERGFDGTIAARGQNKSGGYQEAQARGSR